MSRAVISPGFNLVSVRGGGRIVVRDVDDLKNTGLPKGDAKPASESSEHEAEAEKPSEARDADAQSLEDAYQEGFAQAQAQCEEKHAAEVAALQQRIVALSNELPVQISGYLGELESQICSEVFELGAALAEYIVRLEGPRKLEIGEVVTAALKPLLSFDDVSLHLCPEQAQQLAEAADSRMPASVRIVPDPSLGPGDVFAETPTGRIDATLSGRLDTLKDALRRSLAGMAEST